MNQDREKNKVPEWFKGWCDMQEMPHDYMDFGEYMITILSDIAGQYSLEAYMSFCDRNTYLPALSFQDEDRFAYIRDNLRTVVRAVLDMYEVADGLDYER